MGSCPKCKVEGKREASVKDSTLCKGCVEDSCRIARWFFRYWKKGFGQGPSEEEATGLMDLFTRSGKTESPRDFAKAAVAVLSDRLSKKQVLAMSMAETVVTQEDFAWAAGVLGCLGEVSDGTVKLDAQVVDVAEKVMKQLESMFGVQTEEGFENGGKVYEQILPYLFCHEHPEDLEESEATWAWFAGCFDSEGMCEKTLVSEYKNIRVQAMCSWREKAWKSFFGGRKLKGWLCLKDSDNFIDKVVPYCIDSEESKVLS